MIQNFQKYFKKSNKNFSKKYTEIKKKCLHKIFLILTDLYNWPFFDRIWMKIRIIAKKSKLNVFSIWYLKYKILYQNSRKISSSLFAKKYSNSFVFATGPLHHRTNFCFKDIYPDLNCINKDFSNRFWFQKFNFNNRRNTQDNK